MNYYFIAYIFLCIVIGLTVAMKLFQSSRSIAGIISLILFIFIFVFYGRRWFKNNTVIGQYTGTWPPIINTCPDYLVYFKRNGKDTCVDLLGVNRSGGLLRPWARDDNPENPPADDAKYFRYIFRPKMHPKDMRILCNAAMQSGLTWEGITNGEHCTYIPPPVVLGPNANVSSSSSCPTPEPIYK